jgi:hypothetical protein
VAAVNRIESKLQDLSVNVATVNSRKPTFHQTGRTCYFCGRRDSHAKTRCPAYGKTCNKCGKHNHFAKVCRTMSRSATN